MGSVIKSDLRLGFPLPSLHQRDKLVSNLRVHMWHPRPIFYFKPGQIINTPNVEERLFADMSLWALGNSTTDLTQSSLSALFQGNSRLSSVAVKSFRPPYRVLSGRAWELLTSSPGRDLKASNLGPVYMVSVTRDSPPPETTLSSVYMRIAWPWRIKPLYGQNIEYPYINVMVHTWMLNAINL